MLGPHELVVPEMSLIARLDEGASHPVCEIVPSQKKPPRRGP
jgi:hypothetical protein